MVAPLQGPAGRGAQAGGTGKALLWDQPCLWHLHKRVRVAGKWRQPPPRRQEAPAGGDAGSTAAPGKGSHHLPGEKLLPFASPKGVWWAEAGRHTAPGPPMPGVAGAGDAGDTLAQPHSCRLHAPQALGRARTSAQLGTVKRRHAQAPWRPVLPPPPLLQDELFFTDLCANNADPHPMPLTPARPPTLHTGHLLQHHHLCHSGVTWCSPWASQQQPQPSRSWHRERWVQDTVLAG